MLKSFIRLTEQRFDPEVGDCPIDNTEYCGEHYDYPLPLKRGDVVKWIQKIGTLLDDYDLVDLKIGITLDCELVYPNIGTITASATQFFCTATMPLNIDFDKCYEFIIYTDYNPVDCSELSGITFDELEAMETLIGDINCTFDELE